MATNIGRPGTAPLAPHRQSAQEVLAALGSDERRGLDSAEARARLERFGPNELLAEPPVPAWRRLLAQFQDVLIVLLLIATAVSIGLWLYERNTAWPYEGLAILAIVLLNGLLGYVQEARAERAVAALRAMSAAEASVIRDGERRHLPTSQIVPGDVILIEEGDAIPADARLVHSTALRVSEASLTGESVAVSKNTAPLAAEDPALGDRHNMLFSGTSAAYGRGLAVVTATGMQTEMGRIAGLLHESRPEPTPLQRELDWIGKLLGGIVLAIAAVVVVTILLVRQAYDLATIVETLLLGVALAVAAVPEGLPAIVTAVLALGVQRMARRKAIVRRLPSVETLGSATVIASDKTGTLTRNEMTVRTVVTAGGRVELSGTGYEPRGTIQHDGQPLHDEALQFELERALRAAERANNAALQQHDGQWCIEGDPTEAALVVAARKAGLDRHDLDARFERIGEVPFSSERKLMSTAHRDARRARVVLFCKGALAAILPRCSHELVGRQARPLDDQRRAAIRECNQQLASESLRTLALAFRSLPSEALPEGAELDERLEQDLVFLGLVGMLDPPRPEARAAVARALGAGIRPMMVTGDHPATAVAIARDLGITSDERVIAGHELQALSEPELDRAVREVSVYARVDPEHKLRIVRALQRQGEVVAMTGDGVNDAPALRAADIGVAMGITGTDVSKEAADMVLADDNFATIVAAVEEGRAIFANIQKFLRYLLSSNVGEVLTMFLGVVLGGLLGLTGEGEALVLPLLATQILWINLVTDGPPALALGLDPPDPDLMEQQPRPRGSAVIGGAMWAGIAFVGLIMAVGTLLVLDSALPGGLIDGPTHGAGEPFAYARTLAFTTLVLFQLFNVFNARSDSRSALPDLFRNRWLWGAVLLSLALQVLVVYSPFLQGAFGTVALAGGDWLRCALVASSVLWLRELWKLAQRRRAGASAAA